MATMTITTTGPQDQRIIVAFGNMLGTADIVDGVSTPRNATAAEVKAAVVKYIREVVFAYEVDVARKAAAETVTPIAPT